MSWFKRKPEPPLDEQLIEARDRLTRQIQILNMENFRVRNEDREKQQELIAQLQAELDLIEGCIADA